MIYSCVIYSFGKLHSPELFSYLDCFFMGSFLTFLCMYCLGNERRRFHLVTGCNRKNISVKMNRTALISGIRKDFRNGFKHAEILMPMINRTPAFTILFHAFRSAKDFPAAILTDANGNKNRNVLNLTAPAAFQVNTIYVNIGIVPGKRTGTSGFDMFICLFIQIADDSGGYFRSI